MNGCGDSSLPEVEVGSNSESNTDTNNTIEFKNISKLSEGSSTHSCVIFENGDLACWGGNSSGQLGLGSTQNIGDNELPNQKVSLGSLDVSQVATGWAHTCALFTNGKVRCWGSSGSGRLGLGRIENIGDDEIPTEDINLGGATVTDIATGYDHTCALLNTGNVRCWGDNEYGQLGLGNTNDIGDDETPTVDVNLGGATVTKVSAGGFSTCVLLSTGDVRCWGRGGRLGLGNSDDIGDDESPTANINLGGASVTQITSADSHSCALLSTGDVRCWGSNSDGQLGIGNTNVIGDNEDPFTNVNLGGATATQVSVGSSISCALLSTGNVRCWGRGVNGQLGIESIVDIGDDENPTTDVDLGGETVTQIHTSSNYVCALLASKNVRCWGWGTQGRLGIGSTDDVGDDESPTVNVGDSSS